MVDYYRNPETQRAFAEKNDQDVRKVTSFADATKLSMEATVLANATGFHAGRRGMYGPACKDVREMASLLPADQMLGTGLVDYALGAAPHTGAFVIVHEDSPLKKAQLAYYKLGDGPFYVFYTPFHLPHIQIASTIGRAVIHRDATVAPIGGPVCEVVTVAKRDLKAGERLDGVGGFCAYGLIDNADFGSCHSGAADRPLRGLCIALRCFEGRGVVVRRCGSPAWPFGRSSYGRNRLFDGRLWMLESGKASIRQLAVGEVGYVHVIQRGIRYDSCHLEVGIATAGSACRRVGLIMLDRSFWQGRNVFLTGHTGFKGSWLSLWLDALGAKVTGYALDPPTQPNLFEQAAVGSCHPTRSAATFATFSGSRQRSRSAAPTWSFTWRRSPSCVAATTIRSKPIRRM